MNKKFIKEHYNDFSNDLTDTDIMKVISFIVKSKKYDSMKRCHIQQFLLNCICVGTLIEQYID